LRNTKFKNIIYRNQHKTVSTYWKIYLKASTFSKHTAILVVHSNT